MRFYYNTSFTNTYSIRVYHITLVYLFAIRQWMRGIFSIRALTLFVGEANIQRVCDKIAHKEQNSMFSSVYSLYLFFWFFFSIFSVLFIRFVIHGHLDNIENQINYSTILYCCAKTLLLHTNLLHWCIV